MQTSPSLAFIFESTAETRDTHLIAEYELSCSYHIACALQLRSDIRSKSIVINTSNQMSILGNIISKIFHHDNAAAPTTASPKDITLNTVPNTASSSAAAAAAPTAMSNVDVEAQLSGMAAKYSHPVNWRESIVDLMAMLGIDNSLPQRRELADELGYTGDTNDTATMNIWLHKQVMQKLAANGGKVPAELM